MSRPKWFNLCLLQIFALLGLLALALWLSMRPKSAKFTILDFSALMDNQAAANNGTLIFLMEMENPNKYSSIYYDDINVTFFHDQSRLGSTAIPKFKQRKKATTLAMKHVVVDSREWKTLVRTTRNGTGIELQVGVASRIRFRTLGVRSKRRVMQLKGGFSVGADGKISGKKKIKLRKGSVK